MFLEIMPHKKLSELITFYYLWKKKSGLKEKIKSVTTGGKTCDYQMTEIGTVTPLFTPLILFERHGRTRTKQS